MAPMAESGSSEYPLWRRKGHYGTPCVGALIILFSFGFICGRFLYRRSSAVFCWSSTYVLSWTTGAPSVQGGSQCPILRWCLQCHWAWGLRWGICNFSVVHNSRPTYINASMQYYPSLWCVEGHQTEEVPTAPPISYTGWYIYRIASRSRPVSYICSRMMLHRS